ncbi:MAG: TonB C-terminal domain-containing protein [Pseudomonadota bacterium]
MSSEKDSFSRFVAISVAFHVAVLVLLTVKVLFFPSQAPEHKSAVRIDVVALPEKQVEKPKIAKKAPMVETPKPMPMPMPKPMVAKAPKPMPKPKPKPKPKKKTVHLEKKKKETKEEQNSAIARLKALQKLKDNESKPIPKEKKGNSISKGNALTGLEKLHHESYLDDLDQHIRSYWNLPEWLANGNFKAKVLLKINRNGGIQEKLFVLKSGNELFDSQVVSTLEKANPFPAPPSNLVDFFATKGVEIRFPE